MSKTITFSDCETYQWSCHDSSKRYPVENPATAEIITLVQGGDAETANAAIRAANHAYHSDWRWRAPSERGQYLVRCADALESHKEELATLLCIENGKPFKDALDADVNFVCRVFRYFGSLIDKLPTQFYDQGCIYTTVLHEPHGVCVGILPFNWPPIHAGGKLAPALAAGNTMVLKPGEQAPLTVMRIVEILQTVLPKDVVQAVPGVGPEVPNALVVHPDVKKVSFTGSTRTGAAVFKAAAAKIMPLALELGGKNAFVVFEDADIERAVRNALEGGFYNKGEACTAASRVLVQRGIYDDFIAKLAAAVRKLRVGNGRDPLTHVGPCVSRSQQEKLLEYIALGKAEGARIVAQADLPHDPQLAKGFFVTPTLFSEVQRHMRIATEEMFGPIVTVTPFETEGEAISIVNESRYGLVAAIYTRDTEKALRVVRKVDVGMTFVNNYFRSTLGTPFGGVNDSGFGREHCIETLLEWSRPKTVRMPSGLGHLPSWRAIADVFDEGLN